MKALKSGKEGDRSGLVVTLEIRVSGLEELIEALRDLRDAMVKCSKQS